MVCEASYSQKNHCIYGRSTQNPGRCRRDNEGEDEKCRPQKMRAVSSEEKEDGFDDEREELDRPQHETSNRSEVAVSIGR